MMNSKRGTAIHIEPHTGEKAVCRPGAEWWVQSAVYAAISIFLLVTMLWSKTPSPPAMVILLLIALCVSVIFAVYSAKTYIVATPEGLRWSRLQGVGSARWSEVRDYYEILSSSVTRSVLPRATYRMEIVTEQGTVHLWSNWHGPQQLREAVQRLAVAAEVQEWEYQGTRANDPWPRTFRYWDRQSGLAWGATSAATAIFAGAAFWCAADKILLPNIPLMGWGWSLAMAALAAPVLLIPALFSGIVAGIYWQWWLHRDQYFVVNPIGFTYVEGNATTQIAWEDVGDYYTVTGSAFWGLRFLLALRGREERNLCFNGLLRDSALLAAIIVRYAPCPASTKSEWRMQSGDAESRVNREWLHTADSVERRIFGYRAPEWRVIFGIPLALLATLPLVMLLNWALEGERNERYDAGLVFVLAVAVVLIATWTFMHHCYIRIDSLGIASITPIGRKSIPWIAVKDYGGTTDPWILGRDGTRIRFGGFGAEKRVVMEEIQHHAPRPLTGWGDP